jgi:hypothetical protein
MSANLHRTVETALGLVHSLLTEVTAGPFNEQRREDCRTIHAALVVAVNRAMDAWANGELSAWDQEVLTVTSQTLGDIRTVVRQGWLEIRRGIDT